MTEMINAQIIINKIENNDVQWLYNHFSEDFQDVTSINDLKQILSQYNTVRGQNHLYRHLYVNRLQEYIWFDNKMKTGASVVLNKYQEIIGMTLVPVKHIHGLKQSKQYYTIPIKSTCLVYWGGDNELLNYHYQYKHQRLAIDLIKVDEGCTYQGDVSQCENYYIYDLPIVAPANGVVEEIVDGIPDSIPGEMNTVHPEGNYIIIKHGHKEYSMIAHIKPHSFKIEKGDELLRGQHIAHVGNSGNSSEPHIHFQVMNDKNIQVTQPLKIKFHNDISPVKGDEITYNGDSILIKKETLLSKIAKNIHTNIAHLFKG
ncbi:M23 family metallopeptidase [Staphylococcus sp. GSSP0090]|nr:M23 family metallopeptidase [Staphylococcus sp. GSSP0090]